MMQRKFYRNVYLYLGIGLLIVFWGFSRTYFGRLGETTLPYHIHGISATLWLILLIVQPFLYRLGKLKLHRYLGWVTTLLVPVLVIAGVKMMILMVINQENYPPNIVYNLAFIDLVTLIGFSVFYTLAMYFRKNIFLHARFMVCTIFGPLIPALTRIFFSLGLANSFQESLTYSYLLTELVIIAIIYFERFKKEMKYSYLPLLIFIILQHVLMYFANEWEWWVTFMNILSGNR